MAELWPKPESIIGKPAGGDLWPDPVKVVGKPSPAEAPKPAPTPVSNILQQQDMPSTSVASNFFSWDNLKSMFSKDSLKRTGSQIIGTDPNAPLQAREFLQGASVPGQAAGFVADVITKTVSAPVVIANDKTLRFDLKSAKKIWDNAQTLPSIVGDIVSGNSLKNGELQLPNGHVIPAGPGNPTLAGTGAFAGELLRQALGAYVLSVMGRKVATKEYKPQEVNPREFLDTAKAKGIKLPQPLQQAMEQAEQQGIKVVVRGSGSASPVRVKVGAALGGNPKVSSQFAPITPDGALPGPGGYMTVRQQFGLAPTAPSPATPPVAAIRPPVLPTIREQMGVPAPQAETTPTIQVGDQQVPVVQSLRQQMTSGTAPSVPQSQKPVTTTLPKELHGELSVVLDEIKSDPQLKDNPAWQSMLQKVNGGSKLTLTPEEAKYLSDELANIVDKDREEFPAISRAASQVLERIKQQTPAPAPIRTPSSNEIQASKGARPIGEFEKTNKAAEPSKQAFKLFERTQQFIKKYAGMFGETHAPKGTSGVFFPRTKNILVKGRNDVSTVAHETTHYVDDKFGVSKRLIAESKRNSELRESLTDIYQSFYPGGKEKHPLKTRIVEGLATFLQKYTEDPTEIKALYPELVNAFLKEGGEYYHPVFPEMVKDLRGIVDEYQGLDPLSKIGSRVQSGKTAYDKNTFLNFKEKVYTELFDELYPLEKMSSKAGQEMTEADISLWARMYKNHGQVSHNNIFGGKGYWAYQNGSFTKKYDYNWKSLVDSLEKKDISEKFASFLVARRAHFSYEELYELKLLVSKTEKALQAAMEDGDDMAIKEAAEAHEMVKAKYQDLEQILKNDGITKQEADAAYAQGKGQFSDEEEMFDNLTSADLDLLHDPTVQLVTKEEYAELSNKVGYAPFQREIFNEIIGERGFGDTAVQVGKGKVTSMLKRRGSQKAILNPVYSAMRNHVEIMRKALQQVTFNKVAESSSLWPDLMQELPLDSAYNPKTKTTTFPQAKDKNIIMARRNYKRVPILVNDAIVRRTINDIFAQDNTGYIGHIWQTFARLFTKGTTAYYAPFSLTNYTVDQITATANTMNNYIPVYDSIKNIGKALTKRDSKEAEYFQEYMALGGERQTIVSWQDMSPNDILRAVTEEKKGLDLALDYLEKGVGVLAAPSKYSEIMTRATEYIKARQAGKPQVVALEQAGQVSVPFHHIGRLGGTVGRMAIRSVPFANPGFQALGIALKKVSNPKTARRYAFVAAAVTAALVAELAYIATNASDDQKQQYKDIDPKMLAKFIFIPKSSGNGFFRVRIPDQMAVPGAIINMIVADKVLNARYTAGEYVTSGTAFLPTQLNPTEGWSWLMSLIPQIFKPGLLTAVGKKDFPRISDIESQSVQNLPPGARSDERSSAVAKFLGEKFNISPMKTDFLITGYLGRASAPLLGTPGSYNPLKSLNQQYYFQTGRTMQKYYEIRTMAAQEKAYNKKFKKQFSDLTPVQRNLVQARTKLIDKLVENYRKIDIEKDRDRAIELRGQILEKVDVLIEDWEKMLNS